MEKRPERQISGSGSIRKVRAAMRSLSGSDLSRSRHTSVGSSKFAEGDDHDSDDSVNLKPKMSLMNGVGIIVGSIIGSGIFVSPTGVLKHAGSVGLALIIWVLTGFLSMLGAYCYAELGIAIMKSGGDYAYIHEAFGSVFAFLRLWTEALIVRPCSQAIVALTFSYYVMEPLFPDCEQPQIAVRLLAVVCIMVLTAVNAYDVNYATRVQDIFTIAKLAALILIIFTGIVQACRGEVTNFYGAWEDTTTNAGSLSLAFFSGLFAYNGWNYLNCVIEELKEPEKNLPKAIAMSCLIVMSVYVLCNLAYFTVVSKGEMLAAQAVAVVFAQKIYGVMWWIIPVFVALSTFGGVNGILFTTARLFFVGARNGHMPRMLLMVQTQRMTPAPAVIFMGLTSLLYLVSTDMYALIDYVTFSNWLAITMSVVALLWLRKKRPELHRPLNIPLIAPITFIVISSCLIIFSIYQAPTQTGVGCLIIASGIPVYIICAMPKRHPKPIERAITGLTILIQKVLICLPEEQKPEEKA